MIQTADQYEFVYKVLVSYLDTQVQESIYQNVDVRRKPSADVPPVPLRVTQSSAALPGMPAYSEPDTMSTTDRLAGLQADLATVEGFGETEVGVGNSQYVLAGSGGGGADEEDEADYGFSA